MEHGKTLACNLHLVQSLIQTMLVINNSTGKRSTQGKLRTSIRQTCISFLL
jgi:hypothetical protein